MNRKQLTTLIIACIVLGVIGSIVYNKRSADDSSDQQLGRKVFKDFPINDVERIAIRQGPAQVNLVKQNDIWTVQERNNYPANFSTISEFLPIGNPNSVPGADCGSRRAMSSSGPGRSCCGGANGLGACG